MNFKEKIYIAGHTGKVGRVLFEEIKKETMKALLFGHIKRWIC